MNIAVILAGGKGSRMKRNTNKVLEKICGKPIICYLVEQLLSKNIAVYVVIGQNHTEIKEVLQDKVNYIVQDTPLGTGHALLCACEQITENAEKVLVLNGDGPIFESDLLDEMLAGDFALKILIDRLSEEHKFGRIIRQNGKISNIIEARDCTAEQLSINEINLGMYCFDFANLRNNITKISRKNAQNEYYVTDLVELFYKQDLQIKGVYAENYFVLNGVNTVAELNFAQEKMKQYINEKLAHQGVRLMDPNNTYIDYDARIENGCTIYPNVHIVGKTKIGKNVEILPNCYIENSLIFDNIKIGANCVLVNTEVQENILHSTLHSTLKCAKNTKNI